MRNVDVDVLDLAVRRDGQLVSDLRARRRQAQRGAVRRLVIDFGERRTLPPAAIRQLVLIHRELDAAGGGCAAVVAPALGVQISVSHPEGITFAARREVAVAVLARTRARVGMCSRVTGQRLELRLAGELDLAGLARVDHELAEATAFARAGREVVFDLRRLGFIDAGGLRAVVQAAVLSQLAGAHTRVVGAPEQMLRLLERLGWIDQLTNVLAPPDFERSALGWVSRDDGPPVPASRPAAVLAALDDHLDDGLEALIATDLGGRVTHWNGAATRLYGWLREEVIGRPITELTVGPRDAAVAEEVMEAVRRTGAWQGEFEVQRKDGSTFVAYVRDSVFAGADGAPAGILGLSVRAA